MRLARERGKPCLLSRATAKPSADLLRDDTAETGMIEDGGGQGTAEYGIARGGQLCLATEG
ncbi:hypothetical protein BRADO2094 [Bradyrhizobium sp. ORS 278]|nr:hypothetical protein BRADO2094 [Bradyrhizobium sp. ORS 278]